MIKNKKEADDIALSLNSGYWAVNGIYYFHKGDALRYASKTNANVTYHFFDDIYDKANWFKEPIESFEELCKRRAQQLRDKYNYLALSYSGGADSTNVLQSFLKNNIKLDEVVTFFRVEDAEKDIDKFNINDRSGENYMYEYMYAVKPVLKWLSIHHPEIKITVIDISESSINVVYDCQSHNYVLGGLITTPTLIGHAKIRDHMLKYSHGAALIFAVDKPRLAFNHSTKTFFTYFHDFNTFLGNWSQTPGQYTSTEYFYYTPKMPELLVKSTLTLKNALTPIMLNSSNVLYKHITFPSKNAGFSIIDVHSDFCKKILYPTWNTNTYQVEKLSSFLWPEYT
ncbi:MAG: hypothetical protein RLY61_893, partial [Candidatus Parcubacteria bacterium]